VFLLSPSRARQLSRDIPADVGFLCHEVAVLVVATNKKRALSLIGVNCRLPGDRVYDSN
jgi:hypothetical protein